MAFNDTLALVGAILIGSAEVFAVTDLHLATILLGLALSVLVAAFRVAYLLVAIIIGTCVAGGILLDRFNKTSNCHKFNTNIGGLRESILRIHTPRWLAGIIHLFGLWYLPVCILWGYFDVYNKELFYSEELGHQLASMSYMTLFVITPLLLMPAGYENPQLKHQKYESIIMMLCATIYYSCFRIAHIIEGRNPPLLTGKI